MLSLPPLAFWLTLTNQCQLTTGCPSHQGVPELRAVFGSFSTAGDLSPRPRRCEHRSTPPLFAASCGHNPKASLNRFHAAFAAPRSMKTASPLGQGGTSGGFWA